MNPIIPPVNPSQTAVINSYRKESYILNDKLKEAETKIFHKDFVIDNLHKEMKKILEEKNYWKVKCLRETSYFGSWRYSKPDLPVSMEISE